MIPNETMQSDDANSLSRSKLASALDTLVNGNFQDRWEVSKIFSKLGEECVAPLIDLLQTEQIEPEIKWFVANILSDFNHPQAISTLVDLLQTDDEDLSGIAAKAIGKMGTAAVDALSQQLAHAETKLLTVQALSYIYCPTTIDALLTVVRDPEAAVRATAIAALNSFDDPRILPVLIHALADLAISVRREAVIGLGLVASRSRCDLGNLVELLAPRLHDFNLEVCQQAAIALGRVKNAEAADVLFQVLSSSVTPVVLQLEIVRVLGWMEILPAVKYLQKALSQIDVPEITNEIITILGRISQPDLRTEASQILIAFLKSAHLSLSHLSIIQAIALSLGQLGDREAIDPLIQLLAEPNMGTRLHVIKALGQLDAQVAKERLQQLITESNDELDQGRAIALRELG